MAARMRDQAARPPARPPDVQRLERALLSSWPALATAFDGDWVIRLADGVTKRSNSVACLGPEGRDLEARIDRAVALFLRHRLPPIFRISPLAPPALRAALDRRGWRRFEESLVMIAPLPDAPAGRGPGRGGAGHGIRIETAPDAAWLEGCCRIDGLSAGGAATLLRMLGGLVPVAGYGRLIRDGRIAALAMAVVDAELVGLFEVMTAADRRRQGLARTLLARMLGWGREQGAATGWLAVVADNLPAVGLYRSLGFREVYRYHYRSPG